MVVVTGIFVMVTGVVMANLPKFRNQASLDLTAQEVALSIREAQVYGTATKVSGGEYPSYGIHFDIKNSTANKNFVLFADDGNRVFDPGIDPGDGCGLTVGECLERYALDGPFYILKICTNDGSNEECITYNDGVDISLDLVYRRPFPEPSICVDGNSNDCDYTNATIVIGSPQGDESKLIKVWNNGQISVANPVTL